MPASSAQMPRSGLAMKSPKPKNEAVRRRMSATKSTDNALELNLRSKLFARGLRFRVHRAIVPNSRRTVDVVFPRARVAIYVDGCFWHGCPIHRTFPKNNSAWWLRKIEQNIGRDRDSDSRLKDAGWIVIRVWEHEDLVTASRRIALIVRRRSRLGPNGREHRME